MKIVQGDEIPVLEGPSAVRAGILNRRIILTGEDDTPGNFVFGLYYQVGDFFSPRHRHNVDQYRFQIEGEADFGRNGKMKPGMLGYFPESAFYGPQASSKASTTAVVQFGGPSGAGYASTKQIADASKELREFGVFEKGVYRRNDGVPGKKNTDAYQAAWEHVRKRPLVYPKPQYASPILLDTNNYQWSPLDGAADVEEQIFGAFTECQMRCARYRVKAGARFTARGRGIYFAQSGRGSVDGRPLRALTSVYLDSGETATFAAVETAEILLLGLPDEARMRQPYAGEPARVAAE
jgi:hypothetical protein